MDHRKREAEGKSRWSNILRYVSPLCILAAVAVISGSTNHPHLGSFSPKERFSYPDTAEAIDVVHAILPVLSTTYLAENLAYFSSFRTRYYNSDTGKASSEWLLQKIQNYTNELASEEQRAIITVKPFTHSWLQTSIVCAYILFLRVQLSPLSFSDHPICITWRSRHRSHDGYWCSLR